MWKSYKTKDPTTTLVTSVQIIIHKEEHWKRKICANTICETYEWRTRNINLCVIVPQRKWYVVYRFVKKNMSHQTMCEITTRMLAYVRHISQRWIVISDTSTQIITWRKCKQVGCYTRLRNFTKWTHLLSQEDYK